ncbi:hypothetical protein LXA43DRAFT_1181574 [Ganoderma leucocontextum]|nr:hypothetical protein LXA43DRAFT_1181574 [Ganoderma leucocontextum]
MPSYTNVKLNVRNDDSVGEEWDIIGFDPRGIGLSEILINRKLPKFVPTPVACRSGAFVQLAAASSPPPSFNGILEPSESDRLDKALVINPTAGTFPPVSSPMAAVYHSLDVYKMPRQSVDVEALAQELARYLQMTAEDTEVLSQDPTRRDELIGELYKQLGIAKLTPRKSFEERVERLHLAFAAMMVFNQYKVGYALRDLPDLERKVERRRHELTYLQCVFQAALRGRWP